MANMARANIAVTNTGNTECRTNIHEVHHYTVAIVHQHNADICTVKHSEVLLRSL